MERHPSTSSCNCGAKLQMLQFGYVWIRTKYGTFWTQGACDFSRKFTSALWACGDCDVLGINVVKECGENQSARVILMNFKLRIDLSWQFLRFANWHLNWKSTFFRLERVPFSSVFSRNFQKENARHQNRGKNLQRDAALMQWCWKTQ